MRADPFTLRRLPKFHPSRLAFTLYSRGVEKACRFRFAACSIEDKLPPSLPDVNVQPSPDSAVTPKQLSLLAAALDSTEAMSQTSIAEVGCYRGITTRFLSTRTARTVYAVDPFAGYGGSGSDLTIFNQNTQGLSNIVPVRKTSGDAARSWQNGPLGLVFIDAVHDYVNVAHDIDAWESNLAPRGILALHDTDNSQFPGARLAVFEALRSKRFTLFAHVKDLTMLCKSTP